ncbi:MAG: helix-turn-helix domain-containing protein [Candidatus Bathyarchaeota archaeon]
MKRVEILRDSETIKLLTDLVRREILRLLAVEPLTQTQLARRMMLKEPSMSHHLQLLRKAGLIRIRRTKVGPHGILEKYYEPTANLFLEDWEKIPPDLRRYLVHSHMERLRGMLSVFQLLAEEQGQSIDVNSREVIDLAQTIASHIAHIGEHYKKINRNMDREILLIRIYSDTLKSQMADNKWKSFFSRMGRPTHLAVSP